MSRSELVVAAAQSSSVRGDLAGNLAEHLRFVRAAATLGADLLVFPELSLIGYELGLAGALQLETGDPRLEPLRSAAREHGLQVVAGGPWASGLDRPYLGAFVLSAGRDVCYAKVHVHESETGHFAAGEEGCVVPIRGLAVGLAICADTAHPQHVSECVARGAVLYAASVMKTDAEYPGHAARLAGYAARHRIAVLTANHAGITGGRASAGRSALWNERGELLAEADRGGRALVLGRLGDGGWRGEVIIDP